jgi:hypothetical protein
MKLLIDTTARRVLFAEASKDVVDFLFSLLALPVGTAVGLLGTESMVGSAGHLYASVARLDRAYVLPGADLDALLRPALPSPAAASNISLLRLPGPSSSAAAPSKQFFWCGQNHSPSCSWRPGNNYVAEASGGKCPTCGTPMTDVTYLAPPESGAKAVGGVGARGFVQGVVTYTVTDNLTVTPMSAISSMTLLNSLGVRDFRALQEKTVRLGSREVSIPTPAIVNLLNRFMTD